MSGSTVTVSGDRSVAVAGDIRDSIVVTGDHNMLVVPEALAGTLLQRLARAPTITARGRPVAVLPPAYGDRIGRAAEIAALRRHPGRSLSVVGEGLIGKTYVLSAAFDAATSVATPDGIVFLYGHGRPLMDLLQAVWEAFYDSDPPTVPSDLQIRRELADREGVVVIDSAELTHADAQSLAAALPRSRVVVVSQVRSWWDGDAVTVAGLAEGDALALLTRELGGRIAPADELAARVVYQALGGRPVAIKQVAGLVRGGEPLAAVAERLREFCGAGGGAAAGGGDADTVVARAAVARASASEQDLLAALKPFQGVPVGLPLLDELLGRPTGEQATGLAESGLLRRGSPRFALALPAGAVAMLDGEVAERAAQRAVHWASHASAEALHAELDPLLALWRGLIDRAPYQAAVALGRVLVPALVRARRFATWGGVAELLDRVAGEAGDTATQAWARHELGTHAAATGDTARGVALLREALSMRRGLGDRAGVRATRRNLRLVAPRTRPPWMRAIVLALLTAAVAFGPMAILLDGDDATVPGADATEDDDDPETDGTEDADSTENDPETDGTEGADSTENDPESEGTETEDTETEATETGDTEDTQGSQPRRVRVTPIGEGDRVRRVADGDDDVTPVEPDDPDADGIDCLERCTDDVYPPAPAVTPPAASHPPIALAPPAPSTHPTTGVDDVLFLPPAAPQPPIPLQLPAPPPTHPITGLGDVLFLLVIGGALLDLGVVAVRGVKRPVPQSRPTSPGAQQQSPGGRQPPGWREPAP
jgi:hypothetical protein